MRGSVWLVEWATFGDTRIASRSWFFAADPARFITGALPPLTHSLSHSQVAFDDTYAAYYSDDDGSVYGNQVATSDDVYDSDALECSTEYDHCFDDTSYGDDFSLNYCEGFYTDDFRVRDVFGGTGGQGGGWPAARLRCGGSASGGGGVWRFRETRWAVRLFLTF